MFQENSNNNVYEEIMLILEGHSIIINNADQDVCVYDNSNNCIIPEPCQRCNTVYCNSECSHMDDEFPLPPPLTRIVTNAHIPDEEEEADIEANIPLCSNCGKNKVIIENQYCFKDSCSVCNLEFYSTQPN